MTLTETQRNTALKLLDDYKRAGLTVTNQGEILKFRDFDQKRRAAIGEIANLLRGFLEGKNELSAFKESNEILCRQHHYWGFQSFSGQMVLNQLCNWSNGSREMTRALQTALTAPSNKAESSQKIAALVNALPALLPKEKRIRRGSFPYFLSYFWQIQAPDQIPVAYSSAKLTLSETGLLEAQDDLAAYFTSFWNVNDALADLYSANYELTDINRYWFVEHVLWAYGREPAVPSAGARPKAAKPSPAPRKQGMAFMDFIPPVLQDFPVLARNNSLVFEGKVMLFFKMMGFQVDPMGQGKGRKPDGIARCREHNYAILFDAKSAEDGYRLGTDDRTLIEYIRSYDKELRKEGYSNLYFILVSSSFKGDAKASINRIRKDTSAKSVVLATADQCLRLLSKKIEDPTLFDLEAFQTLLLDGGEISDQQIDEFLDA